MYVGLAGHEHHEAVDADADTRCGRHTVLQSAEEVLVDNHSFIVALVGEAHLLYEALFLVDWVVELRVGVGKFLAVYHKFETLGKTRLRAVLLGERAHLHRVVGDKGGLNELAFASFAEYFVDKFALTHGFIGLDAEFIGYFAYFFFVLALEVVAGLFLDGFEDRQTAIWSLEANEIAVDHTFRLAVDFGTDGFEQVFGETHHPVVVLVLNIQLHTSKLRVVSAVHTLVAEVLAYFIYTFETTHNQSLKIEFGGDAHIHILVERIEVSDKRASRGTTGYRLQGGSLNFGITGLVEHAAHGAKHGGTLEESVLNAIVHYEVDVALTVAKFGVVESVVGNAIFNLNDRQWANRLAEHGEALGMYRDFAGLSAEHKALHAHKVAYIEQFLEHYIIQVFILIGAQLVAIDIHLYATFAVLKFHKRSLTHDATAHDATCYAHLAWLGIVAERGLHLFGVGIYLVFGCRIGLYAHLAQLVQTVTSDDFLFT